MATTKPAVPKRKNAPRKAAPGATVAPPVGNAAAASKRRTPRAVLRPPPRTVTPPTEAKADHKPLGMGLLPSASTLSTAENIISGLAGLAPTRLTHQVRAMTERMMNWAGTAAEVAVGATAPLIKEPTRRAALEKAGEVLKDARETAGLTVHDVAAALDFSDTNLLDLAENGRIALPFEVILRLAALLARNDPVPFVMNLTRVYNPGLWKIIEQLGIGKLALHVGREREFINIYRSRDDARHLSDAEFKRVVHFTGDAFGAAVDLVALSRPPAAEKKDAGGKAEK